MYAPRRIRSFVLREGRVTAAQERALTELWPAFGIDFVAVPLDLDAAFHGASRDGTPPRDLLPHDVTDHNATPHDALPHDALPHDAAAQDKLPHQATAHVAPPRIALPHDAPANVARPHDVLLHVAPPRAARRRARRCMEIGFGAGEVLSSLAAANPHIDYLGIEVHRPGVGRLLLQLERAKLSNVRVICHDAVEVLRTAIAPYALDEVLVFFPDPWHKKRHHKRRLVDAEFVAVLADKMAPGAILRLATDWHDYAEQMLRVCNANERLASLSPDGGFVPRPEFREPTRFERRAERLGHGVWDLAFVKRADRSAQEAATDTVDDELHREGSEHHAR